MALQEAGLLLLRHEAGNVAWDSNVKAIEDGQDQLRPAGGNGTNTGNLCQFRSHPSLSRSLI